MNALRALALACLVAGVVAVGGCSDGTATPEDGTVTERPSSSSAATKAEKRRAKAEAKRQARERKRAKARARARARRKRERTLARRLEREREQELAREAARAERERQQAEERELEQAATESDCEPGYDPCVPSYPPDLDCADLDGPYSVSGSDPHGLDADRDGSGCEY